MKKIKLTESAMKKFAHGRDFHCVALRARRRNGKCTHQLTRRLCIRALREPSAGLVAVQPFRAEEHARDGVVGCSSSIASSCWPHSSSIPDHDHLLLQRAH
jgi:hypothetical protein